MSQGRAMGDPVPPTQTEIARQLGALGVGADAAITSDERIYTALVDMWRERRAPPSMGEVARRARIPHGTMNDILVRLGDAGRVIRVRRGVWLPVVTKRKGSKR